MITYGDPRYKITAGEAERRMLEFLRAARDWRLDAVRDLLIATGQIEQAAADGGLDTLPFEEATDCVAEYCMDVYRGHAPDSGLLDRTERLLCKGLAGARDLEVKLPEGFAFYCLYPEQYAEAAYEWILARQPAPTLVVGLRSIGTTGSAIVRAALATKGWPARRITVRPSGQSFNRVVQLPAGTVFPRAIVVDEGPGLSGSSMAAAATALKKAGATDITLFPGHSNPPGSAAVETVREIWAGMPRIVNPVIGVDWTKSSVAEVLREQTEKILNSPVRAAFDLSGGKWREFCQIYDDGPFITPAFEQAKYLMQCRNGSALLWKFAGLGPGRDLELLAKRAFERQQQLSANGWCSAPVAECCGFVASPWQGGRSLMAGDLTRGILERLSRFILDAACPPLSPAESEAALDRLRLMCEINFRECGLEEITKEVCRLLEKVDQKGLAGLPACGDGRMAPHEWILTAERIRKTDVWGHSFDHSFPGGQPLLWDIAGTMIEWSLSASAMRGLVERIGRAGHRIEPRAVSLYLLAYCAFRIGMCSLASDDRGVRWYSQAAGNLRFAL